MATDYKSLKVVDLKAELKRLGLPQNGLKAELVARLEAAAAEDVASDSPESTIEETTVEETIGTVSDNAQSSEAPEAVQSIQPEPDAAPPEDTASAPIPTATQGLPVTADTTAQASAEVSSDATPLRPAEVAQDAQKRKRRSLSPQPSADEVARKRPRQDDEGSQELVAPGPIPDKSKDSPHEREQEGSQQAPEVEMKDARDEAPIQLEQNQEDKAGVAETAATDSAPTAAIQNGHPTDSAMTDAEPARDEAETETETGPQEQVDNTYLAEMERDVEPSIHPATPALYIKNFMRPLRAQTVKDHLLQLATPTGTPVDDNTVVDFYLDSIRTHAFAVFNSISAASRVRTALHGCVYPDETNRKPLWVDFIPPDCFTDWVDMEQGSSGGRGSSSRFEVVYSDDHDGNVTARLEESGAAPPATKPAPQFERKPSIPTGPPRPSGIENAPLGPRGFQPTSRGPPVHPSRLERQEQPLSTRTQPIVTYQPVSEELAKRRHDALSAAKSKDHSQDFGKDYKRYYFENGDRLVDRGPEIFLGIRPPHRERERRREQGRGPPRGGRAFRRGPPPSTFAPHGVPRGGDRFRPPGSSAFDDRPRYGNDRGGSRRNGYGRY
ncbi:hypothetical protein F5X99DRAFT_369167 [Biscogniauxia marginata]|nr:hypothetical protein F5X99DRAFT_369167 [Biscogniauxia marginata]